MFLIAIQKNPPIMNLDGYADINRGLITAVSEYFSSFSNFNRLNFRNNFFLIRMFHLWQRTWSFCYNLN